MKKRINSLTASVVAGKKLDALRIQLLNPELTNFLAHQSRTTGSPNAESLLLECAKAGSLDLVILMVDRLRDKILLKATDAVIKAGYRDHWELAEYLVGCRGKVKEDIRTRE